MTDATVANEARSGRQRQDGDIVETLAGPSTLRRGNQRAVKRVEFTERGRKMILIARAEYGDDCKNGHNTFSVTGEIWTNPKGRDCESCGCLHEDISRLIPEWAPLLKWHLFDAENGPLHYIANTVFLAGDRDCWGKRRGDVDRYEEEVRFGDFPLGWKTRDAAFMKWLGTVEGSDFEVIGIGHPRGEFKAKWTLGGAPDKWHECPFDTEREAMGFLEAMGLGWRIERVPVSWSEGKPRELDKARLAACWPEATDEDLTAPGLKERLEARLPAMMAEFRAAVESLGFVW